MATYYYPEDDDDDYDPDAFVTCHTCGGDGIVDSVSQETGRWDWDDDGPGTCPNCNGSGDGRDSTYY